MSNLTPADREALSYRLGYRSGAIAALRDAADDMQGNPIPQDGTEEAAIHQVRWEIAIEELRDRANHIEAGRRANPVGAGESE